MINLTESSVIHIDNKSAIHTEDSETSSEKSVIRLHAVRDAVMKCKVSLWKVRSEHNHSDYQTKATEVSTFRYHRDVARGAILPIQGSWRIVDS